jgi:ABC-type uncharacterized transport system permease subunit
VLKGCADVNPAAVEPWGSRRRTIRLIRAVHLSPSPATDGATEAFKQEMLEPAMLIGLGAVAVWTHVNYPRLRPRSLVRAILHVAISFGAFATLPAVVGFLLPLVPSPAQARFIVLVLLIPTLTYVFLTWVWLIARILNDLGGTPRGGHPASNES